MGKLSEKKKPEKSEKMQLAALLGVVFCLLPGFTNSEVFSSVADMQAVFQLERSLVNILLDYAGKLQGKLSRIKKLAFVQSDPGIRSLDRKPFCSVCRNDNHFTRGCKVR